MEQRPHPPGFWVTRHESRPFRHESRPFFGLTECRLGATTVSPPGVLGHETRDTRHESRLFPRAAQASANSELFTKHETRNTRHGFFSNCQLDPLPGIAHDCPALPTIARLPRGRMETASSASWMHPVPAQPSLSREQEHPPTNTAREPRPYRLPGFWGHETPDTKHGFFSRHGFFLFSRRGATAAPTPKVLGFTKHETRNTKHGLYGARRKPARIPSFSRNTKHETRNTRHGFFSRHESRDTAFFPRDKMDGDCLPSNGATACGVLGFWVLVHESRNTKHETRLFIETRITAFVVFSA